MHFTIINTLKPICLRRQRRQFKQLAPQTPPPSSSPAGLPQSSQLAHPHRPNGTSTTRMCRTSHPANLTSSTNGSTAIIDSSMRREAKRRASIRLAGRCATRTTTMCPSSRKAVSVYWCARWNADRQRAQVCTWDPPYATRQDGSNWASSVQTGACEFDCLFFTSQISIRINHIFRSCKGGRMQLRPCRGHCGYPVTHFWRHAPGGVFFQSKGIHDHERPDLKNSAETRRTLGIVGRKTRTSKKTLQKQESLFKKVYKIEIRVHLT